MSHETPWKKNFNPFLANVLILDPPKTPENLWFSGVFRGYKMKTLAGNGLIKLENKQTEAL